MKTSKLKFGDPKPVDYSAGPYNISTVVTGTYYKIGKWTERELEVIRTHGPDMTAKSIARNFLPRRWYEDVRRQRCKMGIKFEGKGKRWSDDELEILEKYGDSLPPEHLMQMLPGRTKGSIMTRRCKMGIQYKAGHEVTYQINRII